MSTILHFVFNIFYKRGVLISFFLINSLFLQAQQSLNLRAGVDAGGLGFGYHFAQGGSVLKKGGEGYYQSNLAFHLSLQYRFSRIFAVETGFVYTEYDLGVHDVQFIKRNGLPSSSSQKYDSKAAQPGWLGAFRHYYGPKFSIYQHIPLGQRFYAYFSEGMMLNYIINSVPYVNTYSSGTETETLTTQFKPFFMSGYLETGINYYSEKNVNLYFGVKYIYAGTMMHSNYSDISSTGTVINTDQVSANGSYIAFSLHIGGSIWHKNKKPEKIYDTRQEQAKTLPKPTQPIAKDTHHVPPAERNIKIVHTVQVHTNEILIEVWDHETVDGDVLSLALNDTTILDSYALIQNKKILKVMLHPGQNPLVMTAINQGRYKPCTAAILIDDGQTKQTYILDADFAISSSLVIEYNP